MSAKARSSGGPSLATALGCSTNTNSPRSWFASAANHCDKALAATVVISLKTHVHFHVCGVCGVCEALPDGVTFHSATGLDEVAIAQVQVNVRKRILRAFVARGYLEACDAKGMNEPAAFSRLGGGFSDDAGVLSKPPSALGGSAYCVRPPFPWTGSSSAALTWSTAVARATRSQCSLTSIRVNW